MYMNTNTLMCMRFVHKQIIVHYRHIQIVHTNHMSITWSVDRCDIISVPAQSQVCKYIYTTMMKVRQMCPVYIRLLFPIIETLRLRVWHCVCVRVWICVWPTKVDILWFSIQLHDSCLLIAFVSIGFPYGKGEFLYILHAYTARSGVSSNSLGSSSIFVICLQLYVL